jgi:allantoinase
MKTIHVIRSERVVTPEGVRAATVHIRNGTITAVRGRDDLPGGANVYDARESVVMPGLVDTHVHINEPGRTDWEGFDTGTRAAAAGGITTLIDMPLNNIPATTTVAALEAKRSAARKKCWVNLGFWGGVVPGNASELRAMYRAGVFGFKCFLVPSGVPEFEHVTEQDLRAAMPTLVELGAPLLVHAELPGPIEKRMKQLGKADPTRHSSWLFSRPPAAEYDAIALIIRLCREYVGRAHIVHLSNARALGLLRRAKKEGLAISVETCPHYLHFSTRDIGRGATEFKCAPPIREKDNRKRLWNGLAKGTIDLVASDHSPSPPEMKCKDTGDFFRAWGGISSVQLSLSVMWTLMTDRDYPLDWLVRWMCAEPARLAGLQNYKGAIAVGYDADLVIFNPTERFKVQLDAPKRVIKEPFKLHSRHKLTPYANRVLRGVVEATFLRGEMIYDRGRFLGAPRGELLRRGER